MPIGTTRRIVAAALFAVGLAPSEELGSSRAFAAGDQITVAQVADVLSLDPSADTTIIGLNVYLNVFDQLTEINLDGSVGPRIATAWGHNADLSVWTFTIRGDAKFHDGQALTMDDVAWSFEKIRADAKSPARPYLSRVKAIERLDDVTIRFTLDGPFVPFDRQVTLISILPRKVYERIGAQQFSLQPVGSGPFKVVRWVKDTHVELSANAEYWGGAPKVKKVFFKPVPSEAARAAALISGELDIVPVLPPTLIDRLAARPGINIEKVLSNRALFLGFNHANPALADLKLRQAIDCAIDREKITQSLLRGFGEPVGQVAAPVIFGYDPDVKPTQYDVARARRLVAESGYKGEKIALHFPTNRFAFGDQVAAAITNSLTSIGINVELQGMEFSAFFPMWRQDKFSGIFLYGIGISVMDSDLLLGFQYEGGISHGYWSSPEVDALIKAQRAEGDREKRKQLIGRIWRISQENVVYAPLYTEIHGYGVRDGIKWKPRPDERLRFKEAEIVTVK